MHYRVLRKEKDEYARRSHQVWREIDGDTVEHLPLDNLR